MNDKRPVARRACLLCREKKIKCDGEPLLMVTLVGGNKVVPQDTRVCSNCRFLGIDCVFVQLNRGGRRKKRPSVDEPAVAYHPMIMMPQIKPYYHPELHLSLSDYRLVPESREGKWLESELAKYDLPPWSVLDRAINMYYKYRQPSHQLLPSKTLLMANSVLETDALVLHAIILNVCILPEAQMVCDERHWLQLMDKHRESLTDYSLLVVYSLASTCHLVRYHLQQLNHYNRLLWEIIHRNRYMEVYSARYFDPVLPVTRRQKYEREILLRCIWLFYLNNLVFYRLTRGFPYEKLSHLLKDYHLEQWETDSLMFSQLVIPSKLSGKYQVGYHVPGAVFDINAALHNESYATVLVVRYLEKILDGIALGTLVDDHTTELDPILQHHIDTGYMVINHQEKLFCINLKVFVVKHAMGAAFLLNHLYFLHDILPFKLFKRLPQPYPTEPLPPAIPLVADVLPASAADFESFPSIISQFSSQRWHLFVRLIIVSFELFNLIDPFPSQYDYEVTFGPTDNDDEYDHWWENPTLRLSRAAAGDRYTEFSVVVQSINLLVLLLLAVLTKYIAILPGSCLRVQLLATGEIKTIPSVVAPSCLVADFTLDNYKQKLASLQQFLRHHTKKSVYHNYTNKLDKIDCCLHEILAMI